MYHFRILLTWSFVAVIACTSCTKKAQDRRPSCISVKTMKVAASTHNVGKNYMGTIEEEDGANVTFGVIGNVVRVMVEEGQFVKKGQSMAEVDGQNVRNAHEISAATLNQAEDAYRRLKDLYDKGTLPEIKMVEMETALAKAKAAEAISRKSVSEIVLRAPFDGYVASSNVHEGAGATPGITGFRLVKIDRGQLVSFSVDALGDSIFHGKIVNRGVTANAVSHSYSVKAIVDNRHHDLLPGMVCKVRMENNSGDYTIVIPQQAIEISGQDKFVWTVKEGKAHRQDILAGDIISEGVIIESGLTTGNIVIVEGQNKVCEGMDVVVSSEK